MAIAAAYLLGLCVGSFLNVCIWRLPRGQSVVAPGSRCPACRAPLAWRDNIPLLSYALLLGRCRTCGAAISWRYPVVELSSGLLAAAACWHWGVERGAWAWVAPAYAASAALLLIGFIDCYTRRIPDVLSLGLLGLGLAASPLNPQLAGGAVQRLLWSAAGAAAGFAICWAVARLGKALFKREAMGEGDIYMLSAVGAWGGPLGAYDCLVLAAMFGSAAALALLASGKVTRKGKIPFGPFLAAGGIAGLFWLMPFGFPL